MILKPIRWAIVLIKNDILSFESTIGMAHLHGYKVEHMTSSLRKHGFVLRPPEPQMRTFSFCAENETHKER